MCKTNDAIKAFAHHHRLNTVVDECGELIIPGKRNTANHVYHHGNWPGESDPRTLAVMFMPDPHGKGGPTDVQWDHRRKALEAAGCAVVCDADGEGYARFDPTDPCQVRAALRAGSIRPRRRVSSKHRERLTARLQDLSRSR
jgi:hypothetical protein